MTCRHHLAFRTWWFPAPNYFINRKYFLRKLNIEKVLKQLNQQVMSCLKFKSLISKILIDHLNALEIQLDTFLLTRQISSFNQRGILVTSFKIFSTLEIKIFRCWRCESDRKELCSITRAKKEICISKYFEILSWSLIQFFYDTSHWTGRRPR